MPETFRVKSSHVNLTVKSYAVADSDLLDFNNANPLEMGEWLTIDASNHAVRAANPGVAPGPFVMFAEKGRSDLQGIGGRGKVPLVVLGTFIGETLIFNTTAAPVLGALLEVADVTWDALTKSGLQTHAGGATPVIGHVIRTAASNNDWLKFVYTAS